MTDDDLRIVAAGLMRELGHEFVARDLSDDQLAALIAALRIELADAREAAPRTRAFSLDGGPHHRPDVRGDR